MMYAQRAAAQYRNILTHGLVADARPTRLVQIMYEQTLSNLATAQGCMQRIENCLPLNEVMAKGKAMSTAIRLVGHLNATLDMERGGEVAANLRSLYDYMLNRLTQANVLNDPSLVEEVSGLISKIKASWDRLVQEGL
jgi:flagellar protein FliS